MKKELRSDRIAQQCQRLVEAWDGRDRGVSRSAEEDLLAQCKRASLRNQSRRMALELSALARRAAEEAPEVHDRLRHAVEALQLLSARLRLADEAGAPADSRREVF